MTSIPALLQRWNGLQWPDSTVVVMASGESLVKEQCQAVALWSARDRARRKTIVVNTTYQIALWADLLWACDKPWWDSYYSKVRGSLFSGELWTQDEEAARVYGLRFIRSVDDPGLGRRPGLIHQGKNGGYQAVNLAVQAGARRVILLGFDMKGGHWHGDHPLPLSNPKPYLYAMWRKNFARMAIDLATDGVDVVNCTPGSALECFPKLPLNAVLEDESNLPDPA